MTGQTGDPAPLMGDVAAAVNIFAIDPTGTGLVLRGRIGWVREVVLALLGEARPDAPLRRIPVGVPDERLLGGLDLVATLRTGRPILTPGLLAEMNGGIAVLTTAERMSGSMAAHLSAVLDTGETAFDPRSLKRGAPARFGLIALDEGAEESERMPEILLERIALRVETDSLPARGGLPGLATADDIAAARQRLPGVTVPDDVLEALCATALALGISSLRAPLMALAAARAAAAHAGRSAVTEADAVLAARLVLAPRATMLPSVEAEAEPSQPEQRQGEGSNSQAAGPEDVVLAAALAALPDGLLARLTAKAAEHRGERRGRTGSLREGVHRGRPAGLRRAPPRGGARLSIIATLRAAAPWQMFRRQQARGNEQSTGRFHVMPDDFRVLRLKQHAPTTTILVVDASGSSASHRLAEAKGAAELLLSESYTRRDRVALISFRRAGAEILLPPTRSLARVKRSLAALPGGGGTPLAAGLDAGAALADTVRRRGETPTLVILSDGCANVARDGIARREQAQAEALASARRLRADGYRSVLIDISPRAEPAASRLAEAMGALYLPLPHANAHLLSRTVRAASERGGSGVR